MHRRQALAAIAGSAAAVPAMSRSAVSAPLETVAPGLIDVSLGEEFRVDRSSTPIGEKGSEFSLVSMGVGKLTLDADRRLTAKIHAGVTEYANVDYWVSLAVFDKRNDFLGAAAQKIAVQYIRLGVIPTMLPELEFDFGISKRYNEVARLAVAISDRDVPEPGVG